VYALLKYELNYTENEIPSVERDIFVYTYHGTIFYSPLANHAENSLRLQHFTGLIPVSEGSFITTAEDTAGRLLELAAMYRYTQDERYLDATIKLERGIRLVLERYGYFPAMVGMDLQAYDVSKKDDALVRDALYLSKLLTYRVKPEIFVEVGEFEAKLQLCPKNFRAFTILQIKKDGVVIEDQATLSKATEKIKEYMQSARNSTIVELIANHNLNSGIKAAMCRDRLSYATPEDQLGYQVRLILIGDERVPDYCASYYCSDYLKLMSKYALLKGTISMEPINFRKDDRDDLFFIYRFIYSGYYEASEEIELLDYGRFTPKEKGDEPELVDFKIYRRPYVKAVFTTAEASIVKKSVTVETLPSGIYTIHDAKVGDVVVRIPKRDKIAIITVPTMKENVLDTLETKALIKGDAELFITVAENYRAYSNLHGLGCTDCKSFKTIMAVRSGRLEDFQELTKYFEKSSYFENGSSYSVGMTHLERMYRLVREFYEQDFESIVDSVVVPSLEKSDKDSETEYLLESCISKAAVWNLPVGEMLVEVLEGYRNPNNFSKLKLILLRSEKYKDVVEAIGNNDNERALELLSAYEDNNIKEKLLREINKDSFSRLKKDILKVAKELVEKGDKSKVEEVVKVSKQALNLLNDEDVEYILTVLTEYTEGKTDLDTAREMLAEHFGWEVGYEEEPEVNATQVYSPPKPQKSGGMPKKIIIVAIVVVVALVAAGAARYRKRIMKGIRR